MNLVERSERDIRGNPGPDNDVTVLIKEYSWITSS